MAMATRNALPQNYISKSPEIIADFETIGAWSKSGTGNLSADTTNYRTGTQGMKLETTVPETVVRGHCSTINWQPGANKTIAIWYYVPEPAKIYNIEFIVSSVTDLSKYLKYVEGAVPQTGWNCIYIRLDQWTATNGDSLSNKIVYMRFAVQTKSGQTSYITFDSVEVNEGGRPRCIVMLDDGRESCYTVAKDILEDRGIPGTFYVVSDWVGTSGKMTLANLQELYANGHAIANHTSDHSDLTTLTEANQEAVILAGQNYLLTNGFSRSAKHLAYPYGRSNANTVIAKTSAGILTSRSLGLWPTKGYECSFHALGALIQLVDPADVAAIKASIDSAIASESSFCILAHGFDDGGPSAISTSDFTTIMDYLVEKRIKCVTIDEWYNGLTNPRYRSLPVGRA